MLKFYQFINMSANSRRKSQMGQLQTIKNFTHDQKRTFVLVILYTDLSFPFLDFISFLALNAHILPAFTINKT